MAVTPTIRTFEAHAVDKVLIIYSALHPSNLMKHAYSVDLMAIG